MGRRQRITRRIVITATVLWLVLISVTIGTKWCIFGLYHRPTTTGSHANNLWLVSGRFAWRHYDLAASPYPDARSSGISVEFVRNHSPHWFWKTYFTTQYDGWFIGVPLWIPLAPLTVIGPLPLAVRGVVAVRRGRRARRGRCPSCNYDLTGTPNAVCPECGKASEA